MPVWLAALLVASAVRADPWLQAGDEGLRSDLLLLADAGVLRGPVTTWPLSWPDIARDVLAADVGDYDQMTAAALLRIQRLARAASALGFAGAGVRARVAYEPSMLRTFEDTPREEGEVAFRASWLSDHYALNLQAAAVANADDDKTFRLDGSYLGVNIGNFMISVGFMERWWTPAWEGGLIMSTNARPIPSITLERNYTDPFKTKLFSWIGPWRASIALGEAETHDVAVVNVRFLAARINFRPRKWLEFGLTRTAQWCGGQRDCDVDTFMDMLLGREDTDDSTGPGDTPGNQMAGYDMRLRSPWKKLPLAFYTQWIGEDEAGGLPSKFIGTFGLEGWTATPIGALRIHAEYSDTACTFHRQEPDYDCAYRNAIYPQGYTYRGRIIGHAMDNDSRMYSLAGLLTRPSGDVISVLLRRTEVNRDGSGSHAISTVPRDLDNVELRYSRVFGFGKVMVGAGLEKRGEDSGSGSNAHAYISWQQGF
jgi:hypothetical protein